MMVSDDPLIYTSKGNLPVDNLDYQTAWEFDGNGITFSETYLFDGEIVRRSAHRYQFPTEATAILQEGFNG